MSGGAPLSGLENVLVSSTGVETETDVQTVGEAHQTSTSAGKVVVNKDCTATTTQTKGGVTDTRNAVLIFSASNVQAGNAVQPAVSGVPIPSLLETEDPYLP